MDEKSVIYLYNNVLMTNNYKYFTQLTEDKSASKEEIFGIIWRYAIGYVLDWDPRDAAVNFNSDILEKMKLSWTFEYAGINYNSRRYFNFRLPMSIAYPDSVRYSLTDEVNDFTDKALCIGNYSGCSDKYTYPKGYFLGAIGLKRVNLAVKHVIGVYLGNMSNRELYEFFADTKKAKKWLINKRLWIHVKSYYESPLKCLHDSLTGDKKSELYYQNILIREQLKKQVIK